jgi:hypothetical protein
MFYGFCRVCPFFEKSAENGGCAANAEKTSKKRGIYLFSVEH